MGMLPPKAQPSAPPGADVIADTAGQDQVPPFTVTETLAREYTLTFAGEVISHDDLLSGYDLIASEAMEAGAYSNIVASTDGAGRIVLHFCSESTYEGYGGRVVSVRFCASRHDNAANPPSSSYHP